jgi:dTDP-4-dehydrorhamnose 3,5-epimerase-like enzyme
MSPSVIKGGFYQDERGELKFNNSFNASEVKRIYFIQNRDTTFERGWQGHKIEQRWFTVVTGKFLINTLLVENWEIPCSNLNSLAFEINADSFDVLHIPNGYITCIRALEDNSKLMVMSDYLMGETNDEVRYSLDKFPRT